MHRTSDLPVSSPQEKVRANILSSIIKRSIATSLTGSISFQEFMGIALYNHRYGYYTSNKYKFGRNGDFITAPITSRLFSHSFANVFARIIRKLDPNYSCIVEFGAGDGTFAVDCLLKLKQMNSLPRRYIIIDISSGLADVQKAHLKKNLPDYYPFISWCSKIPDNITETVIIFANEVLDSMPVELFEYYKGNIYQQRVIEDGENFKFIRSTEIKSRLRSAVLNTGVVSTSSGSYNSEVNLWIDPWFKTISSNLREAIVFVCDYGYHRYLYYHPERINGTLRCYYKHYAHNNPLINIGIQDITSHVDFTTVAESATRNNFHLESYSQQNQFLISAGILECYQELIARRTITSKEKFLLTQQLKKLTLSTDFYDAFKVMTLSLGRDKSIDLPEPRDLSYLL